MVGVDPNPPLESDAGGGGDEAFGDLGDDL